MKDKHPKETCPICGKESLTELAALSRYDDKTKVCPDCGQLEAFSGRVIVTARALHLNFQNYAGILMSKPVPDIVKAIRKATKLYQQHLKDTGQLPNYMKDI